MREGTKWKVISLALVAFLVGMLVTTALAGGGTTTKLSGQANQRVALARGSARVQHPEYHVDESSDRLRLDPDPRRPARDPARDVQR